MTKDHYLSIIIIAIISGIFAGLVGSPGFAIIVPLMFMFNVTDNFKIAIGIYFLGVVIPDIVNSIVFGLNNTENIQFKLSILFSILFAIMSGISVYFSKFIEDKHKLYLAGIIQLFIGVWYIWYAFGINGTKIILQQ